MQRERERQEQTRLVWFAESPNRKLAGKNRKEQRKKL